jgi:hypothetical protein
MQAGRWQRRAPDPRVRRGERAATARTLLLLLALSTSLLAFTEARAQDGWEKENAAADAVGFEAATPKEAPTPEAPSVPAASSDESGWDDSSSAADTAGFEAATPTAAPSTVENAASAPLASSLSVSVSLRQRVALWTERLSDQALAQARQSVDVGLRYKKPFILGGHSGSVRLVAEGHAEYDFAYLYQRERYDAATLDAYQYQIIGRDTYAALSWGPLELRAGRQIVAWGQGEILSPLDIVSPRDLREPLLVDLDAMRMAVLSTTLGLFFAKHSFEALVVYESFFGLRPAPLSAFSPLRQLLYDDPRLAPVLPEKSLHYEDVPDRFVQGGTQFYGRWSYTGEGVDLALYGASTLDKQNVLRLPSGAELQNQELALYLWHPRYLMFGHAGAVPLGPVVLRWELGYDHDRALVTRPRDQALAGVDYVLRDRLNMLLSSSYQANSTRLTLEYAQSVVFDNPAREAGSQLALFWPVEQPVFAARLVQTFLRERLSFSAVLMLMGVSPFTGAFGRAELSYMLRDALSLALAYASYFPSSSEFGPIYGFTENDRLYATLRWDFMLE